MLKLLAMLKVVRYTLFLLSLVIAVFLLYSELNEKHKLERVSSQKTLQQRKSSPLLPVEDPPPIKREAATASDLNKLNAIFDCQSPKSNAILEELITLINRDRAAERLSAYRWDAQLCQSAALKNQDMFEYDYFEHVSPSFVTPWHWIDTVGYRYSVAGENLVMNIISAHEIHEALMNSPGHRANLMSETFEEIGIAFAVGGFENEETFLLTQHFAAPLSAGQYISRQNVICSDKDFKAANKNLDEIKESKDQLNEHLDEAEKIYDDIKGSEGDTGEVKKYIETLQKEKKKLKEYENQLEDYLKQCKR